MGEESLPWGEQVSFFAGWMDFQKNKSRKGRWWCLLMQTKQPSLSTFSLATVNSLQRDLCPFYSKSSSWTRCCPEDRMYDSLSQDGLTLWATLPCWSCFRHGFCHSNKKSNLRGFWLDLQCQQVPDHVHLAKKSWWGNTAKWTHHPTSL